MGLYEVPSGSGSVTLSGVPSGRHVYLLKTNPTAKYIATAGEQYVSSVSGTTGSYPLSVLPDNGTGGAEAPEKQRKIANPAMRLAARSVASDGIALAADVSGEDIDRTHSQLSLTACETVKEFWVENDIEMSSFRKVEFILADLGAHCNVWIPNDNGSVPIKTAQMICAKFELTYEDIRGAFGAESEEIFYPDGGSFRLVPMQTLSDTEVSGGLNRVNILVYDLAADGVTSGTTLTGYFHSKDYFPNSDDLASITGGRFSYPDGAAAIGCSNEGKYLYIDSHYAEQDFDLAVSTIIHEFQHLIFWGRRTIPLGVLAPTWYNEMMSMMCEDLFCSRLNLADDNTPLARYPLFCGNWYGAGLEYRDGSGLQLLMSYAYPFAFGDWLMRNFGGRSVVSSMASDGLLGVGSIEKAAGMGMEELLKFFAASCAAKDSSTLGGCGGCSFGKSPDGLKDVDLWRLYDRLSGTYARHKKDGAYGFVGPRVLRYDSRTGMRPWGVKACYVGESAGGGVSVEMALPEASADVRIYLLVSSSAPEDY